MILFSILLALFSVRNLLWHVLAWQKRDYRIDRMKAHLETKQGQTDLFSFWFFRGYLPRPKWTKRAIMITAGALLLAFGVWYVVSMYMPMWLAVLVTDRLLWFLVMIPTGLTHFIRIMAEDRLFKRAKEIRNNATNITVIAITGSYGKSTTKELLAHLLRTNFGSENVLATPKNNNTEVAIARWILANASFFMATNQRYLVVEIGAYKMGEIAKVCKYVQPHISIITAVANQHLSLFGSLENIQKAKWELAQSASNRVYINSASPALMDIAKRIAISAEVIAVDPPEQVRPSLTETSFAFNDITISLPWAGGHFSENAHLAAQVAQSLGISAEVLQASFKTINPPNHSLTVCTEKRGFSVLTDMYSANEKGVHAALSHLALVPGKKVIVMFPLRELSDQTTSVHRIIFEHVKALDAVLFWCDGDDFDTGKQVLGNSFFGYSKAVFKKRLNTLNEQDGVLFISRVPKSALALCSCN